MNNFQQWLIEVKNYKGKSAMDVISRINRMKGFMKLPEKIDDNFILSLNKNTEFAKLSISVRSQLRRALRLLKEYDNQ